MAATIKWYGLAGQHLMNGALDLNTDTLKVSLHTSTYTPNQDTDDFHNDATNELSGTGGYTAGGATLASAALSYDTGTNQARLDATDTVWTSFTPSAPFRYGVIYKDRGGASTADELIAYIDFGANQDPGGSDFTIQWASTGILSATAA